MERCYAVITPLLYWPRTSSKVDSRRQIDGVRSRRVLSSLAEIGDYLDSYSNNPSYFNSRKYFPHQSIEHELRIMNFHKNHL